MPAITAFAPIAAVKALDNKLEGLDGVSHEGMMGGKTVSQPNLLHISS
jgi:hypothetical protein